MDDYIEAFEFLFSRVKKPPEEQLLGYFVGGLQPDIKQKLYTF